MFSVFPIWTTTNAALATSIKRLLCGELARVDLLQSHYCNFWLMYVWLGDFCVSNGSPTVLLTQIMQILSNRVFKSQNSRKPGTLCISCFAWLYADLSRNPKCDTQCITIELWALTCITNWEINFLPALRQQYYMSSIYLYQKWWIAWYLFSQLLRNFSADF